MNTQHRSRLHESQPHVPPAGGPAQEDEQLLRSVKRVLALAPGVPADVPEVDGTPGSDLPRIAGFRVIAELGRGGMGVVYAAEQLHPRRRVALKFIRDGRRAHPDQIARFHREVDALGALHHPAIATVFQAGLTDEGDPYFTMDLVEGRTLAEAVEGMPLRERLELFARICDAVQYAHERAVIHRDLKPGNILVGLQAGSGAESPRAFPKIVDFGVARLDEHGVDQTVTRPGQIHGTPRYMSPEQIRADAPADARSDVYALGAILYELATDTPALHFTESSWHSTVRAVCESRFPRPSLVAPGIPPALERVILMAMSAKPEDRYQSAAALGADVRSRLLGEDVPTPRSRLHRATLRPVRLGLLAVVFLVLLGVALAGVSTPASAGPAIESIAAADNATSAATTNSPERLWLDRNFSVLAPDLGATERRLRRFLAAPDPGAEDQAMETEVTHRLATVLEEQGKHEEIAKLLGAFVETQRQRKEGRSAGVMTLIRLGRAHLACGRLDEAARQLDRANDLLDRSRTTSPAGRSELASSRAILLAIRGDVPGARHHVDEARRFAAAFSGKGYWLLRRADIADAIVHDAAVRAGCAGALAEN